MAELESYSLGQIADLLSSSNAFEGMPRNQALRVVEVMAMREYQQGQVLTQEGADNIGYLMLVVSGEVLITSKLVDGVEVSVYRRAKAGHLIGEVGFVDGKPHSATCTAVTDVQVAMLPREHLTVLLENEPLAAAQLMAGLLKVMSQRLRHANMTVQTLGVVHHGLQKEIETLRNAARAR
jgi:CRP/FNR family transcriptional regulator, cyclic AMP receptor protein